MKNAATAEIERDFPAWTAWISRNGMSWGAVCRDPKPELAATLIADSEEELRAALAAQPADTGRRM